MGVSVALTDQSLETLDLALLSLDLLLLLLIMKYINLIAITMLLMAAPTTSNAQSSAFVYHGRLTDGGTPANNTYDMQLKSFDTAQVDTHPARGLATLASVRSRRRTARVFREKTLQLLNLFLLLGEL